MPTYKSRGRWTFSPSIALLLCTFFAEGDLSVLPYEAIHSDASRRFELYGTQEDIDAGNVQKSWYCSRRVYINYIRFPNLARWKLIAGLCVCLFGGVTLMQCNRFSAAARHVPMDCMSLEAAQQPSMAASCTPHIPSIWRFRGRTLSSLM